MPALGDDDARVAGVHDLPHRVRHVVGRQELTLLDVDDASGLRRGHQEVGLPAQERRNLQDVGHRGRGRRVRRLVDVGENRDTVPAP